MEAGDPAGLDRADVELLAHANDLADAQHLRRTRHLAEGLGRRHQADAEDPVALRPATGGDGHPVLAAGRRGDLDGGADAQVAQVERPLGRQVLCRHGCCLGDVESHRSCHGLFLFSGSLFLKAT